MLLVLLALPLVAAKMCSVQCACPLAAAAAAADGQCAETRCVASCEGECTASCREGAAAVAQCRCEGATEWLEYSVRTNASAAMGESMAAALDYLHDQYDVPYGLPFKDRYVSAKAAAIFLGILLAIVLAAFVLVCVFRRRQRQRTIHAL